MTDASRRTRALNAYFTGIGPSRRIVVYDTLVESLTPAQAGLVVAHEVGHWRRGHIAEGLLLGTLGIGNREERVFSPAEVELLLCAAATLASLHP